MSILDAKAVGENLNLSINENNLVEEWQGQPALMLEYGILLADAQQEMDEAKAYLAVTIAELDSDIRNNPEEHGLVKVTEAAVQAAIPQQQEHKIATKKLNNARHAVHVYQAACDALQQRKAALQGMTDLFMRQWFADPARNETKQDGPPTKKITKRRVRRGAESDS